MQQVAQLQRLQQQLPLFGMRFPIGIVQQAAWAQGAVRPASNGNGSVRFRRYLAMYFSLILQKTSLQTRKCLESWDKFTVATLQHSNGHHDAQEHQGSSASSQQPNGDHDDTTTDDDGESAAKRPRVKDDEEEEVEAPRAGESSIYFLKLFYS